MTLATSPFTLDVFVNDEPYCTEDGIAYARTRIEKTFHDDLEATSTVEMLSVRGEGVGAGYVALETVRGTLHGRTGTFAILHAGTLTEDDMWARWPISPGSGTGELEGSRRGPDRDRPRRRAHPAPRLRAGGAGGPGLAGRRLGRAWGPAGVRDAGPSPSSASARGAAPRSRRTPRSP